MDDELKRMVEYIEKNGGTVTIDNNPSPEKIKQLKTSIKRREELEAMFRKRYLEE